jgi:hypothetical protein
MTRNENRKNVTSIIKKLRRNKEEPYFPRI